MFLISYYVGDYTYFNYYLCNNMLLDDVKELEQTEIVNLGFLSNLLIEE